MFRNLPWLTHEPAKKSLVCVHHLGVSGSLKAGGVGTVATQTLNPKP